MNFRQLFTILPVLTGLLSLASPALADKIGPPQPYETFSADRRFAFSMRVGKDAWNHAQASGAMYALQGGSRKLLWQVKGWYAPQVFVPAGGQYLVRLGNWPNGCGAKAEDLAVAFYKQGKLLKSWSTADLLQNPHSVKCTVSHYFWSNQIKGLLPGKTPLFALETIEKRLLIFNVLTGELRRQ